MTFETNEEVRCGFRVTEKRKKIWKTQLELANEVKRICKEHGIKYFIIWGTLLGAIRHKGFIPWDDDFDIAFLRKDYEHFCKVAQREIREPFFFQTDMTQSEFFIGYARIRDSRTTGMIRNNESISYHNGIYVDLYPLDVIPRNKVVKEIKYLLRDKLREICYCYTRQAPQKSIGLTIRRFLPYRITFNLFKMVCMMGNGLTDRKVGLVYQPELVKTYHFDQSAVTRTVELPFENTSFSAPADYDSVLREVYGKHYMKYPPKRKRGQWHEGMIVYEPDIPYKDYLKKEERESEKI